MAAFRKATPPVPKRRALVASAARYTLAGAQTWNGLSAKEQDWQREAWRQYDMCGEYWFAVNVKSTACSMADLYVAEIDETTGKPIGPAQDQRVVDIGRTILGGPAESPALVAMAVQNLDVAGELWFVIMASRDPKAPGDRWFVLSTAELDTQGGKLSFNDQETGESITLGPDDVIIRVWNKHPKRQLNATSSARAALPILREIERTSQNIAARLDSRLVGAGFIVVPEEVSFAEDAADSEPEEDATLSAMIRKTFTASLADPGSAASQVPIVLEIPAEFADAIKHFDLATELSKEVLALRDSAIGRLAASLDMPREVIEGMGQSNHWSAWQVQEETWRTHLAPPLDVLGNALTTKFLRPMLEAEGIADPARYAVAFDGSSFIESPDPTANTLEFLQRGLIGIEGAQRALNLPPDSLPSEEERKRALALEIVRGAPTTFNDPEIRRILGFGGTQPTPAPPPAAVTASAHADLSVASVAVVFALERAGNRLLNTQRMKREFEDTPRHELHTRLSPDPVRHGDILDDAWRHVPELAARLRLDDYTRRLVASGVPHSDGLLREWVDAL